LPKKFPLNDAFSNTQQPTKEALSAMYCQDTLYQAIFADIRSKNFAALMELYEQNYLALHALIPNLRHRQADALSESNADAPLYFKILARQRYGLECLLTYYFEESADANLLPNAKIRVSFDAKVADVMHLQWQRHPEPSLLQEKWQKNYFLQRWLQFCLRKNHRFEDLYR
jgi:uncharacterized protein YqiB (DUF1249 family)